MLGQLKEEASDSPSPGYRRPNSSEQIAEAAFDGNRKEHMELLSTVPLLIIDDLGMRVRPNWSRNVSAKALLLMIKDQEFPPA